MRRTGAKGDDNVTDIVSDGMKRGELLAELFAERLFVAGYSGSGYKLREFCRDARVRRRRDLLRVSRNRTQTSKHYCCR
jgi:hypothetical protein